MIVLILCYYFFFLYIDDQSSQKLDEKTGAVVLKEDLNKEYVPFQVQIYYVDLNG